jgi:dihydroceramidase
MYGPGSQGLLRPKTDFLSISLLILGIASFIFHATLRQSTQFADELGMLGLGWSLLQSIMTIPGRAEYNRTLNLVLATIFPTFAAFYIYTGKIIYHATAFGIILVFITIRGHYLFLWRKPAFPESRVKGWRWRGRWALFWMVLGYVLWNVDLECCAELRAFRSRLGLPWAWLFELHGWWHVMTAIAADLTMDILREVQKHLEEEEEKKEKSQW